MSRPSLLWVTAEPPNGRLGGGSIRQAELLRRLGGLADVDLLVVGDRTDDDVRAAVRRVIEVDERPVTPAGGRLARAVHTARVLAVERRTAGIAAEQTRAAGLHERALALAPGHDAVVVVHEALADLVPATRGERWYLHLHHVVAARSAQRAALEPDRRRRLRHHVEARNGARWLARTIPRWDGIVTVSDDDARLLGLPAGRATVAPNGVDLHRFRVAPRSPDGPIVLTGSLDYPPNVDGVRWFVDEVWPVLRRDHAGLELDVVGRAPTPEVRRLGAVPGVSVHADVPEVPPFLERASVVVVPVRIGTGTRLKALEAMAAGRPVVGTSIGLEGLDVRDGREALVADDAPAFAAAVGRLLADRDLADELGRNGRALAEQRHGWEPIARDLLAALAGGGPAQSGVAARSSS